MVPYHALSRQPAVVVLRFRSGDVKHVYFPSRHAAELAVSMLPEAQAAGVEEVMNVTSARVVTLDMTLN